MRAGDARNLVTVYRRSETRDDYGDVSPGWTAQPVQAWVSINRDRAALVDYGAGDQPRGAAKGRAHFLADIQIRDVLRVTDGPDVGTDWLVAGVFHPGGRDSDLVLEQSTEVIA